MINTIEIKNFKSITNLQIDLAPFTIFVGPNGAGKSSILEAIALMAQSTKQSQSFSQTLKGDLVDFENIKSILTEGSEKHRLFFGLTIKAKLKDILAFLKKDADIILKNTGISNNTVIVSQSKQRFDHLTSIQKFLSSSNKETVNVGYRFVTNAKMTFLSHRYTLENKTLAKHTLDRKEIRDFPNIPGAKMGDESHFFSSWSRMGDSPLLNYLDGLLHSRLEKVYYLLADRGFIPWVYNPPGRTGPNVLGREPSNWVGNRGQYTIEILSRLMSPQCKDVRLPYELFCAKFGIDNVWAGWDYPNLLTTGYKDQWFGSNHKLPSLGSGSKQLLSVISQLAYADSGSIILIEEPEISLHPSYQHLLPVLFGKAVEEGKQIIVTSHSSYFPLSLGSILKGFVLEGQTTGGKKSYKIQLQPDDIAVYHVTRGKDGASKIEKLDLDENGLKEGIPSFVDVEKEILGKFLQKE